MAKGYNSFSDFFADGNIELKRSVEIATHNDENIANNRLFVWNFEENDLEEFLEYFDIYKNSSINVASRQTLSGNIMRKMNAMLREGYNPVECMLYASKTINSRLQNDKELQEVLAERIKDIYSKQVTETVAVIENIIKMWTWVPQIKVVITAVGMIGDNKELMDKIMQNYSEDSNYKSRVFYALLQNKTADNLTRLLKIIMNLQDTEEDTILGRVFSKEIGGFGYEGIKIIGKYYDNPGISRAGTKILKKIMLKAGTISDAEEDDDLYRKNLANKSLKDDLAFKDFMNDCYERYDADAFFLARFSRAAAGDFVRDVLEDNNVVGNDRDTAIVTMGILGSKGYRPAAALIDDCERYGEGQYSVLIANIILGSEEYAERLADVFASKKDYELSDLYRVIRASGVVNNSNAKKLIQYALEDKFNDLVSRKEYDGLECLTDNFQMFWDKKLYSLFSWEVLSSMQELLMRYSNNREDIPPVIIISLMEIVVQSWNRDVEKTIFSLYNNSNNQRVREVSYKKLKERKIEAPR